MSVIPDTLYRAISALPAADRPGLIAEWATTLPKLEATAERIRAQVRAHPDGFFRHEGEGS